MSDLIDKLNKLNDVEIKSVFDKEFNSYGRIINEYDFDELINYVENNTDIPQDGNVYIPSVEEMEEMSIKYDLQNVFYGGMPIQIGYCNGRNTTYNGFEYHKCSEINVAVTDFMLVLGHSYDIKDCHYNNDDARVFFIPRGTAFEMFQTTLHLSPCRVCDDGFKAIVVLLKGTNTLLGVEERDTIKKLILQENQEAKLLLQRNKWVLAHPNREPLIKNGAFPGIIGENKELYYE